MNIWSYENKFIIPGITSRSSFVWHPQPTKFQKVRGTKFMEICSILKIPATLLYLFLPSSPIFLLRGTILWGWFFLFLMKQATCLIKIARFITRLKLGNRTPKLGTGFCESMGKQYHWRLNSIASLSTRESFFSPGSGHMGCIFWGC